MTDQMDETATLRQRALQFLVHSFLYYRLGESVVSDGFFDTIAAELSRLREAHQDAEMPYAEIIDPLLGKEGSGFAIRNYPPEVVSTAFKLLYATGEADVEFAEFVERRGFQAVLNPEEPV